MRRFCNSAFCLVCSSVRFLLCSLGMAALPSGALVLARGFGVHNESLADKFLTINAVEKHHSILGNYILLRRQVSLRRHVGSASRPGA